jgi:probable HAF family extracellular repeat protein
MKIIRGFKVRGFILAAAFSAGLGFATSASAQVPNRVSYLVDLNSKTVTELGTLGGTYSEAFGINDAGQVVGRSDTAGGVYHAFITGPDGIGMRDLGTLGGGFSEAFGINDAGQVVGESQGHAFITGPDGMGMRVLGTLGGDSSNPVDINDAGQVAGGSWTAGGKPHAFITGPDGMAMRDIGALGDGGSIALGINDAGQVVGTFDTAGGVNHVFITGPDGAGMIDLNSLVDVPGGVILTNAAGINNSGQVVAIGSIIPEPEIYALFLAGLAMIGVIAQRKKMRAA